MEIEVNSRVLLCLLLWLILLIATIARMAWIEADDRGWLRGYDFGYRSGVVRGAAMPWLAEEMNEK